MSAVLKKFGKYFLLDLVAQGGMAEIYRARMETPDGGARLVAIKRVLASYTKNTDFVKMFKAEINTTSSLSHPNIVQIYDFGDINNQLFLSMELIDGKNLRQIINRSIESGLQMPIEICLYIISQAAAAMSYAHSFTDKFSGKSLNIVHRDISPQNILLSYDGSVKLIDFGIAKAVSNAEHTRTGIIKGKPSYLSPEQIQNPSELDGRSDIFALGVVLWEILVGKKLFSAENDFAVIKMIENCSAYVKAPSQVNSHIPQEVDQIVLKSLERDRNDRYRNAEEMQRAINRYISQQYPDLTSSDLAEYIKALFKNEIIKDRQTLMRLNEKAQQLLTMEPEQKKEETRTLAQTKTIPMNENQTNAVTKQQTAGFKAVTSIQNHTSKAVESKPEIVTSKDRFKTNATKTTSQQETGFREYSIDKKDESTNIRLDKNNNVNTTTRISGNYSKVGAFDSGYKTTEIKYSATQKKSSISMAAVVAFIGILGAAAYFLMNDKNTNTKVGVQKELGTLVIDGSDGVTDATIKIDGKVVSNRLPASIPNINVEKEHIVEAFSNGMKKPDPIKVKLSKGESKNVYFAFMPESNNIPNENLFTVRLKVSPLDNIEKTEIKINGKVVDPYSPNALVEFDKPFEIEIQKEGFDIYRKKGIVKSKSELSDRNDWVMEVQLARSSNGYLTLDTTPSFDYAIMSGENGDRKLAMPVLDVPIPAGKYKLKIFNDTLGMYAERNIVIIKGQKEHIELRLGTASKEKIMQNRIPANK